MEPRRVQVDETRRYDNVSMDMDSDDDMLVPDLPLWGRGLLHEMMKYIEDPNDPNPIQHDESWSGQRTWDDILAREGSQYINEFRVRMNALFPRTLLINGFASNAKIPYAVATDYRNSSLLEFLGNVAVFYTHPTRRDGILHGVRQVFEETLPHSRLEARDLRLNGSDIQAIRWDYLRMSREEARRFRKKLYINYVQRTGGELSINDPDIELIPAGDTYLRHTRTEIFRDVCPAHFQLRNVLACHSRTQAFYPTRAGIVSVNALSQQLRFAIKFRTGAAISTIAAGEGVLMTGSLDGYCHVKSLAAESSNSFARGAMSKGIINHLEIHNGRYHNRPQAAITDNESFIRTLDLETMKVVSSWKYERAANCAATSPDRRLRVMVGDYESAYICDAERGNVLRQLTGHRDHGFACAWSDDGRTVATANQDRSIRIWDARKWCNSRGKGTPVCGLYTELASVRCLRFSPVGSGKPVLVAMEEADCVNIINAQTFLSKQTVDMFGELGGVEFTNEGQDLTVLCCDPSRGGLMRFERVGFEAEPMIEQSGRQRDNWDGMIWNPRTNASASQTAEGERPQGYHRRMRGHLIF